MKQYLIPLSGKLGSGLFVKVDKSDYQRLNQRIWHLTNSGYASWTDNKNKCQIFMHREIMGHDRQFEVDHINHDLLDNRRSNLRWCTRSQNNCNRRVSKQTPSGYRGVYLDKKFNPARWRSRIRSYGRTYELGWFGNPEDAAKVYDKAAKELHGPFASTNF